VLYISIFYFIFLLECNLTHINITEFGKPTLRIL
jgi:hypothetical protein